MVTFASDWSGRQVGDFIIDEHIGRGGMAEIYSARQCSVDRQVALKIIELHPGGDSEFLQRFTREAEVIAMLEHIHILPVYGYGVLEDEAAYFAMRLLRNGTLEDVLRNGALALDEAVELFTQIASGLAYIHSRGVIHRDLKPSNILLDENGNAYLSDFGLAQLIDATINPSDAALHVAGSPGYIAPELIQGQVANPLSDIYSLGVILYQMLCGRLPFESGEGGVAALLYQHMHEKPPSPRQLNSAIPSAIEAIILRALSKDPHARFSSAEDMLDALRAAALNAPSSEPRLPQRDLQPGQHRLKLRQWIYLALVLGAVTLLVVLAVFASQTPAAPSMNVVMDARATLADVPLSDAELSLARTRLEPDGFIAYVPCTLTDHFQATVEDELRVRAEQAQLPLRVYDSEDDPASELAMVEQARIEGATAFILCPLSEPLLDDTIVSLQEATIPLVLAQSYNSPYGVKVGLDNAAVGRAQGRYAGQILEAEHDGRGTVVLLSFLDTSAGQSRAQGMADGLRQTTPLAEVLDPLNGATRERARQVIEELIANGTHFDAILTINDDAALGAVDALQATGLSPQDVFIVSANNDTAISRYLGEDRYVRGSITIDPAENAQLLLCGIVKALAGSPVAENLMLSSGTLVTAGLG